LKLFLKIWLITNFTDDRTFFSIANFFDVISNFAFLVIGLIGFVFAWKHKQSTAAWAWIIFFLGVAFVSIGSAYYHLAPDNDRLVWDRLPMTIGFMALFIALLAEYVNEKIEKFLIPAILIGFSSVIYWAFVNDLRFYAWIQVIPLLCIPVVMLLFNSKYSHQRYLIFALLFYIAAKFTETFDSDIYSIIGLSGHTIKHLLASLGPLYIYLMIKKRVLNSNDAGSSPA